MGRSPCCSKVGMNKGAWTALEDKILTSYIRAHGEGKWRNLPKRAGLKRCGKSCRLRWLNYLRPDIKRGNITRDEEELIIRLHKLLGNRWSLIAGRLPGRTDNEIKNYWNTTLGKRLGQAERSSPSPAISKEKNHHPSTKARTTKSPATRSSSRRPSNSTPVKVTRPLVTRAKPMVSCTSIPVPPKSLPNENHQLMFTPITTDLPQLHANHQHQGKSTSQHVQESKNSGTLLHGHCGTQDDLGFLDFGSGDQFSFNFPSGANYKPLCMEQEISEDWTRSAYCMEEKETLDLESLAYFLSSEEWP